MFEMSDAFGQMYCCKVGRREEWNDPYYELRELRAIVAAIEMRTFNSQPIFEHNFVNKMMKNPLSIIYRHYGIRSHKKRAPTLV